MNPSLLIPILELCPLYHEGPDKYTGVPEVC